MMIGATGSGKSTLIDGMVNHLLDVKWEDGFRFKIIDLTGDEEEKSGRQVCYFVVVVVVVAVVAATAKAAATEYQYFL